jgi:trans-aconitate methyltransferase
VSDVAPRAHWDEIYETRAAEDVSWYQRDPEVSLALVTAHSRPESAIVDVGAGQSRLVDRLLELGYHDVTLLDVSRVALDEVARRTGHVGPVTLIESDVRDWRPTRTYDVWHDRAALHFLDRPEGYVEVATAAVIEGGVAIIGVFAPDGPTHCSGLAVTRYDAAGLADLFEASFDLVSDRREEHVTPSGATQPFTWVVLRRRGN